jgi:prepilin-type N-terminal cleavage/methylation domain-containing protein
MKKNKGSQAFTLVEVLVAALITGILSTIIAGVFLSAKNGYIANDSALEVHADARQAMDWMVRDIKWANQAIGSVNIGGTVYSTGLNELVLNIPSVDGSGDIRAGFFDTVVYTLNGTDLMRIVDPDPVSARVARNDTVANNVNNLRFTLNPDNIQVAINTQKTVLNGRVLNDAVVTAVSFRNE